MRVVRRFESEEAAYPATDARMRSLGQTNVGTIIALGHASVAAYTRAGELVDVFRTESSVFSAAVHRPSGVVYVSTCGVLYRWDPALRIREPLAEIGASGLGVSRQGDRICGCVDRKIAVFDVFGVELWSVDKPRGGDVTAMTVTDDGEVVELFTFDHATYLHARITREGFEIIEEDVSGTDPSWFARDAERWVTNRPIPTIVAVDDRRVATDHEVWDRDGSSSNRLYPITPPRAWPPSRDEYDPRATDLVLHDDGGISRLFYDDPVRIDQLDGNGDRLAIETIAAPYRAVILDGGRAYLAPRRNAVHAWDHVIAVDALVYCWLSRSNDRRTLAIAVRGEVIIATAADVKRFAIEDAVTIRAVARDGVHVGGEKFYGVVTNPEWRFVNAPPHSNAAAFAFSDDGRRFAFASWWGFDVLDTDTGALVHRVGNEAPSTACALQFHRDSLFVATADGHVTEFSAS